MKQSTLDKRLKSIEASRSGQASVTIPFTTTEVQPVKDCPICRKPSPMTSTMWFVCRACRFVFS